MTNRKRSGVGRVHGTLVERLVADKGSKRMMPAWSQWCLWLGLSLVVVALFLVGIDLQTGAERVLRQWPPVGFLLTAFAGAALAAWEAIASSVPGRGTGKTYRVLSGSVFLALVAIPFLFLYPAGESFDVLGAFRNGMECVTRVVLAGVLPWIVLGWMVSRNASFHPGWTGAWSGASAFLVGTVTVQLHCPSWDARHMLAAHLLPVFLLSFLTTLLGAYWFSRWKKD